MHSVNNYPLSTFNCKKHRRIDPQTDAAAQFSIFRFQFSISFSAAAIFTQRHSSFVAVKSSSTGG